MKQLIAITLVLVPLLPIALVLHRLVGLGHWLFTWLRGCAIVGLFAFSGLLLLAAYEVARLDYIPMGNTIAKVYIDDAVEESLVTIRYGDKEQSILMKGDAVKVSARAMYFSGFLKRLVPDTFLKVEQLENRYYEFEHDDSLKNLEVAKSALALPFVDTAFDGWLLLDVFEKTLSRIGIQRSSIAAEYIPIQKGAIYHLVWQGYGMEVVPANVAAQDGLGLAANLESQ